MTTTEATEQETARRVREGVQAELDKMAGWIEIRADNLRADGTRQLVNQALERAAEVCDAKAASSRKTEFLVAGMTAEMLAREIRALKT